MIEVADETEAERVKARINEAARWPIVWEITDDTIRPGQPQSVE